MTSRPVRTAAALLTASLAVVHVYWAAGGRAGWATALPQDDEGSPLFRPTPAATLVVAGGLAGMSAAALHADDARTRWPLRLTALALLLRTIGDGRWVGLTRHARNTPFARNDARLYTPLCSLLSAMYATLALGVKDAARQSRAPTA